MDEFLTLGYKMPYAFTGKEYAGWIGPIGHVLFYPIRGGELLNIFAGRVSSDWADESWAVPSETGEMMEAYAGWNESMLSVLAMATEAYKWGIHDRDPLPKLNLGNRKKTLRVKPFFPYLGEPNHVPVCFQSVRWDSQRYY
jgi:hypothetical protein